MRGTIMEWPLLVSSIIDYAADCHGEAEIVARRMDGEIHRYSYAEARMRCRKLSQALIRLGIAPGDAIGGLGWNTHRYFELFYGVSGMGAVLHTINPRLFPDQLVYMIEKAADRFLMIDSGTLELARDLAPRLPGIESYIFMDEPALLPADHGLPSLLSYEELLAGEDGDYAWPVFDEYQAATICFTSGTTGNPKGVVYSNRAAILSSLLVSKQDMIGGFEAGRMEGWMPLAPLFHGNGWQMVYVAPMHGLKLVLPGRDYEPERLYELIEGEGVGVAAGVPTIWILLVDWLRRNDKRFSTLRAALMSGSKPPRSLLEALIGEFGVDAAQAWGMTEALGAAAASLKPGTANLSLDRRLDMKERAGRMAYGTQFRIVDDDGTDLPWDGAATGHLLVRGPIVAGGYLGEDEDAGITGATGARDGWLHTGDVAALHPDGTIGLADRSKDVIKSGGEWISSLELESIAMGHPAVLEAAVIGIAHPTWQERPLLIVLPRPGATPAREDILAHMRERIASWWMPDDVAFIDQMPHTGTGKIHKLSLRERFADYRLPGAAN